MPNGLTAAADAMGGALMVELILTTHTTARVLMSDQT